MLWTLKDGYLSPYHNFPPLQPYFKYLKTISILQIFITELLKSMISRVVKQRFNDHLIYKGCMSSLEIKNTNFKWL